jgi:hypothetical protein
MSTFDYASFGPRLSSSSSDEEEEPTTTTTIEEPAKTIEPSKPIRQPTGYLRVLPTSKVKCDHKCKLCQKNGRTNGKHVS